MNPITLTCIATAATLTLISTATAQSAPQPIKVGVLVSATGPAAPLGANGRAGALLAEKTINAAGGVGGRMLKLIVRDDSTNPDMALTHTKDLVSGEKVEALLALTATTSSIAASSVTHAAVIPQISLSGIGAPIERERKCTVHLAPSQELNAKAMLGYVRSLGLKRVGLLHDAGWGMLVFGEMKRLAPAMGIELVAVEKFDQAATEVTGQAAKIKAAQPEIIAVVSNTAVPYRDLRRLQMTQPIIGGATAASYDIVAAMGAAADNVVFAEAIVSESPTARQRPFVDAYRKEYNALPKGPAMLGWDAVHVAAELIRRAGPGADGAKRCGQIRAGFPGVSWDYNFAADDLNGLQPSQLVFSKLVGGVFTPLAVKITD